MAWSVHGMTQGFIPQPYIYVFKIFLEQKFWKGPLIWEASLAQIIAEQELVKTEKIGISKMIHTFGK